MKNIKKKKSVQAIFSVFVFSIIFLCMSRSAYADDISWYKNNAEILENNSFSSWGIRSIAWKVTQLMVYLANAAENLFDKAFGFIDFTTNKTVNSFILHFKPVLVALVALSIFYLGLLLIKKPGKRPEVSSNIAILVLCVCCSAFIFSELNDLSKSFKKGVESFGARGQKTQATYEVVDNNMIDLIALDEKFKGLEKFNLSSKDDMKKAFGCGIKNKKQFDVINYTEVLNPSSDIYTYRGETKDLLSQKLIITNPLTDESKTRDVYNGFGWNSSDDADLGNEFYYRYHLNSFNTWLQLGALILIFLTMSYKCVRISFELIVGRLLAYLYSTELSGGEKIRKILVFIRDSYILLGVTVICIKLYSVLSGFVTSRFTGLTQGIFSVFIAFCIIDGPNLVEKLLGMDAGLKSSVSRSIAFWRGSKAGVKTGALLAGSGLNAAGKLFKKMGEKEDSLKNTKKGLDDLGKDERNKSGKENRMKDPDFMKEKGKEAGKKKDDLSKVMSDVKGGENDYDSSFMKDGGKADFERGKYDFMNREKEDINSSIKESIKKETGLGFDSKLMGSRNNNDSERNGKNGKAKNNRSNRK